MGGLFSDRVDPFHVLVNHRELEDQLPIREGLSKGVYSIGSTQELSAPTTGSSGCRPQMTNRRRATLVQVREGPENLGRQPN
jgi:hypothetical protein